MAPPTEMPVAANVLGTIGTVCWCIQLVPQLWTNWRTKKTDGFPASMMLLWAVCSIPLGTYSVVKNFNVPIQVQPQCLMVFSLAAWSQCLHYGGNWPVWRAIIAGLVGACVCGALEVVLILTVAPVHARGNKTPVLVIGIVAAVLIVSGFLPPYRELWTRRGRVVGINFCFLLVDMLGALFSLMALVAQDTFDLLGGLNYIICCLLEMGIFCSHVLWLFRTRDVRKAARAEGKFFDEVLAEYAARGEPFRFADRKVCRPPQEPGPEIVQQGEQEDELSTRPAAAAAQAQT